MSTSCVCYAGAQIAPGGTSGGEGSTSGSGGSSGGLGLPSLEGYGYRPIAQEYGKTIDVLEIVLGAVIAIGSILITVFIALTGFGMILGSAEEKAVAKEKFAGYLIAVVILTGWATIAKIIIGVAEKF